jgi:hypothetical protein
MHEFPPSDKPFLDGILMDSRGPFFQRKSREFRSWCKVECLRLKVIPDEGWIGIMGEEERDVGRLPVNDTRDPLWT